MSDFDKVMQDIADMNKRKRADYAGTRHYLANFYDTGKQLQLTAGHSVEVLISTKQSRLRTLLPQMWSDDVMPTNESIEDTLLDRAVYSILALCLYSEGGYTNYDL